MLRRCVRAAAVERDVHRRAAAKERRRRRLAGAARRRGDQPNGAICGGELATEQGSKV